MISHDKLVCLKTGTELIDDGWLLADPASPSPSLMRAVYKSKTLHVHEVNPGLFKYIDWLPVNRPLSGASCPVTYRSQALASYLGLSRLYITFSGFWEEKGAYMTTGTFKECEAYSVCARLPAKPDKALVVASAGNTARAFIKVASENSIPLVVVVPEKNLGSLFTVSPVNPCVKVVAAGGDCDYFDAIDLADRICGIEGFKSEGGAKNVARRDGMGTTVLDAATFIGEIPDYYFQAVGSGTGAIAAYEANLRLNESGQYEKKLISLQVSQNSPFLPIYNAWLSGSNTIADINADEARKLMDAIDAKVLSNRKPPYSIMGGLYDALKATHGDVMSVTNEEAREAQQLFLEREGCDICPEAGVAAASLAKKAHAGEIAADSIIMLNITGGGLRKLKASKELLHVAADAVFTRNEFCGDRMREYCTGILDTLGISNI